VYAAAPELLVRITLGGEFADAAPLLWLFALTMSGYALFNILLFADLGRGGTRVVRLAAAGAVIQLAGLAIFHGTPWQLLTVSAVTSLGLLVVHEIAIDPSLTSALRGWRATRSRLAQRG
jgi:hypothetical protein